MKKNMLISLLIQIFCLIYSEKSTYSYYKYDEIIENFEKLSQTCSQYIRIDTSQDRYHLNSTKGCGKDNCINLIVFLTDFDSYTLDRPTYYVSGSVHGDEVIGVSSILELAKYFCDSYNLNKNSLYHNILKNKLIILTPMTNAHGYYNNRRDDIIYNPKSNNWEFFDANRDYPYLATSSETTIKCMRTITARTINEIFNEFIIIGSLTFHAGDSVLGYAWGNFVHVTKKNNNYISTEAPDFQAFYEMGKIMQKLTISEDNKKKIKDLKLADMSSGVYPLNGALEDWAYAGSWENGVNEKLGINDKPIKKCESDTFSGYNLNWDDLNYDYKLRCIMYLVEASESKNPKKELFGIKNSNENIFDFEKSKNFFGLVPRNLRLIYSAVDLISASVFLDVDKIQNKKDKFTIPFKFMGCISLQKYHIYKIDFNSLSREMLDLNLLTNYINESIVVEESNPNVECYYSNYAKYYYFTIQKKKKQKKLEILRNLQQKDKNTDYFNRPGGNYDYVKNELGITLLNMNDNSLPYKGSIYFIRGESPDINWKKQENPDPKTEPQSHLVRSKTNFSYYIDNGNYTLKSNYYFYSYPIVALDNGDIQIIDDVDSFFYGEVVDLIEFISNPNDDNYKISSQIVLHKKTLNDIYLSSENRFDINLEMHIFEKNGKTLKNSLKAKNLKILSQIVLSSEKEIFKLGRLDCEYNGEVALFIRCPNILKYFIDSKQKITGKYIRQKLPNTIIEFKIISNDNIILSIYGQISFKNQYKGKFYIDDRSEDRNKMICTSNLPNFLSIYKNKFLQNEIYYVINMTKISTKKLKCDINIIKNNKKHAKYFIFLHPFMKQIKLIDIKTQNQFEILLNENSNGKIIGKTAYLIPIEEKDLKKVKDFIEKTDSFKNNIIENFIHALKEETKNKNEKYDYIPCSIMSYQSLYNENSMKELQKMISNLNNTNYSRNRLFFKGDNISFFQILVVSTIVLLLIVVCGCMINKKCCQKSYSQFNEVKNMSVTDIQGFNRFK